MGACDCGVLCKGLDAVFRLSQRQQRYSTGDWLTYRMMACSLQSA